jgi:hypothetical protein
MLAGDPATMASVIYTITVFNVATIANGVGTAPTTAGNSKGVSTLMRDEGALHQVELMPAFGTLGDHLGDALLVGCR